jgi:Trk K+ transport system NAD-binding subunit
MSSKAKRTWVRIAVSVRQNRAALLFVLAWIAANAIVFQISLGVPWADAALFAMCLHKAEGAWGRFYTTFTEVVVFGAVASVVVANVTRRYRPEATSAALAEGAEGHLVVIGYSNLGKRIRDMALEAGADVVVIEENRSLVEEIIQAEEPLLLGNAREPSTLERARIERARVAVIATDDLEAAAVACRIVRSKNATCKLVVRCADDDVGAILAKAYDARVLSTSKVAARFILAKAQKAGARRAVVMGKNNVGKKVGEALRAEGIGCELIDETEDPAALERAGVGSAEVVVLADDDLGKNLVRVDRVRDLNPHCLVVARVFHDDAADLLTQTPFRCVVLSTSRLAAELLADEGVLRDVGVTGKKNKPRR